MPGLWIYGALLGAGAAWGLTVPLTKIMVSGGAHPLGLIFWQFVIGALALGAMLALRGRRLQPKLAAAPYIALVALIGTIIPNSATYVAADQLPAGVMGLNLAMVPIFSLAIAAILRVERLVPRRALGVGFGAAGVLFVVGPEASLPNPAAAAFVFVALIAPFCYGLEGNVIARLAPPDLDAIETLFLASLLGAAIIGPVAYAGGFWAPLPLWHPAAFGAVEQALIGASLLHAAAYSGYIWLVGRAGPVFTSQIAYVVTLLSVLASMAFLGERYSLWIWAAVACMLAGLWFVRPAEDPAAEPAAAR